MKLYLMQHGDALTKNIDPDFFPKMEHLLSLYRSPPKNLIFFDECPGIRCQLLCPVRVNYLGGFVDVCFSA